MMEVIGKIILMTVLIPLWILVDAFKKFAKWVDTDNPLDLTLWTALLLLILLLIALLANGF